jgi:ABC-2 type transport system permease protein
MHGLTVLIRKELLESWRTLRIPIIGGLFLLVGLTSPLLAKFLPEIIKAAAGDQLPTIPIPTPVMADAAAQLWKNLAQFGAFAAIILAMGTVAGELDRGTAAFVLSKTATRGAFLAAKVAAIAIVLAVCTVLAVLVGWFYTAVLFEPPAIAGWITFAGLAWLGLCAWAAITFLGSTMTGSTAAAAGIGFVALLVLSLVSAIPTVSQVGPGGLAAPAMALASGTAVTASDILVPVVSTALLIAVALALAAWSFRRREL